MPRQAKHLNSMVKGRVRASMNKYNLFNLYKKPAISFDRKSLFQQKWLAKQETRSYHGEHLIESRFKQVFNPNLESVAQLDASLKGLKVADTPLTLQTYASLEKRLETAVFRAMFASSIRQARQFILAGHVQVNGVVIRHPSFPLKEGDIFHVEPEKVLMALGRNKPSVAEAVKVDEKQIRAWNAHVKSVKENPLEAWKVRYDKPESLKSSDDQELMKKSIRDFNTKLEKTMLYKQKALSRESVLCRILRCAYSFKQNNGEEEIRVEVFNKIYGEVNAQKCFDVYQRLKDHEVFTDFLEEKVAEYIVKKVPDFKDEAEAKLFGNVKKAVTEIVSYEHENLRKTAEERRLPEDAKTIPYSPDYASHFQFAPQIDKEAILEDEKNAEVKLPWQRHLFGRKNPSKPYFTPWTPRPFIGAFAILPSHIEVSFKTCHAVYMRDPVARPGFSEVISPFATDVHERAYMYYVRKGL